MYGYDEADRLVSADGVLGGSNGQYTSLSAPERVLNTSVAGPIVAAGESRTVDVKVSATTGGGTGVPSGGVAAVVVNVTATGATGSGFLKTYAADDTAPATSTVNFIAGEAVTNLAIVQVSADQKIKVGVGGGGGPSTHIVVDVVGWYATSAGAAGGSFTPISPTRAIDTRVPPETQLVSGTNRSVTVTGIGGVPASGVGAVAVNVTTTAQSGSGFLKAWDGSLTVPNTSVMNFQAGETIAAFAIVKVGASGTISVRVGGGSVPSAHVIVDVVGWFSAGVNPSGDTFTSVDPNRLLDTRTGQVSGDCLPAPCATFSAGTEKSVLVTGLQGVPQSGVSAVSVNITAAAPSGTGDLRVIPSDQTSFSTSTLNYQSGQTIANSTIMRVGPDGRIKLKAFAAGTDVVIDIVGWYSNGTWSYTYNAAGSRLSKTGPDGQTTRYTWAYAGPSQPIMETTGSAVTYYVFGPDGLAVKQINPTGPAFYLHHDQTASTRVITNAGDGAVIATVTYGPFGGVAGTGGPTPTAWDKVPMKFGSGYTDPETGYVITAGNPLDPTTAQYVGASSSLDPPGLAPPLVSNPALTWFGAGTTSGDYRDDVLEEGTAVLLLLSGAAGVSALIFASPTLGLAAAVFSGSALLLSLSRLANSPFTSDGWGNGWNALTDVFWSTLGLAFGFMEGELLWKHLGTLKGLSLRSHFDELLKWATRYNNLLLGLAAKDLSDLLRMLHGSLDSERGALKGC